MLKRLTQWADKHLIEEWRIAHKLWSVRVGLFWSALGGAFIALPAFQAFLSPITFGVLCIGMSVALFIARMTKQPGV